MRTRIAGIASGPADERVLQQTASLAAYGHRIRTLAREALTGPTAAPTVGTEEGASTQWVEAPVARPHAVRLNA